MELVIKIPKELYEAYKGRPPMLGDAGMDMIAQSIANGTPLPKGHGDLIDRKELLDVFWTYCREGDFGYHQAEDLIKSKLAILEADKGKARNEE